MDKAKKLREFFKRREIIRVIGAHNALGAKLAENTGFDCVWSSGLEISTSFGVPDANILSMTDFLNVAISMNESVSMPVIADCDTGFGNSNNVIHMVKKYEAAGIAAVCIEDKHFPKVNSFIPGRQELAPISEFVGKILAAKNAQKDPDFMVIARIEALIAGWGMEEALKRAHAYAEAGADAILIHSKLKTPDEIYEFCAKWKNRLPVVVLPTTYYSVSAKELEKRGIKMVIYANHGIRAAIRAMQEAFSRIYSAHSTASVEDGIATMKEVFELQGMPRMKEEELTLSKSVDEAVIAIIPAAGDHLEEHSMKNISSDIPISMLDINGKPLLQRQMEVLNRCRIYDICCIGGYRKDKLAVEGVKVVDNPEYKSTAILYSVMCGLNQAEGKVLIVYGDVLFDHIIVNRLLESAKDITIIVDSTYDVKHYGPEKKLDLVISDSMVQQARRKLHKDVPGKVLKIGEGVNPQKAHYEFPGIMFLSKKGTKIFKDTYQLCQKKYRGKPFHDARVFEKAHLADILQEIIDSGHPVYCLEENSGWLEIHSLNDYKLACSSVR